MTNKEAIRILRNAAFLATSTSYQAVEEAVGVAVKAMTSATDTNVATKDGDMVYRQDVLDALDEIESEVADGDGFQYEKWRKHFCEMTSARPDHIADDSKKGDVIYRQDAIDALDCINGTEEVLRSLPSAQPETCEGCKHLGKWENEVEYGYPSPCTRCKRRVEDHYER